MMSLEMIVAVNEEIAAHAAARRLRPFVPRDAEEVDHWPPVPFPSIGGFEPPGWKRTATDWFVDKSGHGADWEPALSAERFATELRTYIAANPGHGFAIVEEGEFQAAVAAFRPVPAAK
ncbi:MAG: hypothetical protein WED34_18340 [Planctomycetales bacterium]